MKLIAKYIIRSGKKFFRYTGDVEAKARGDFIFVAAMPKSGGTFLSKKIAEHLKYEYIHLSDRRGGCEFDIYPPAIKKFFHRDVVVHQHTLGTEGNVHYIKKYNMKLIWLVRNLPDALVSFRDHLLHESMRWPFFSAPKNFARFSKEKQYDLIIDLVAPWYLHFYVSWYRQIFLKENINAYTLKYEEFSEQKFQDLIKIFSQTNPQKEEKKIDFDPNYICAKKNYRLNKGVTGRGEAELIERQLDKLRQLKTYFDSDINFEKLGL